MSYEKKDYRVSFWGLGYIGFSGIISYANKDITCFGIDIDPTIKQKIFDKSYKADLLHWLNVDPVEMLKKGIYKIGDSFILPIDQIRTIHHICIPTEKNGKPDNEQLFNVTREIAKYENIRNSRETIVIIESTLIPGTARKCLNMLTERCPEKSIMLGVAPRRDWFISKDKNLENLPRIVGTNSDSASKVIEEELSVVCKTIVHALDYEHAEITKSVENAFRHMDITLANQLCDAFPHMNMRHVLELVGTKWNIDTYYPSFGTGGYCIPLSSRYLKEAAEVSMGLIDETVKYDTMRPTMFAEEIIKMHPSKVGILGIAYKENLKINKNCAIQRMIVQMQKTGIEIYINDVMYKESEIVSTYHAHWFEWLDYQAYKQFDILIINTAHDAYMNFDSNRLHEALQRCWRVYDNCGLLQKMDVTEKLGSRYWLIGTPKLF